MIAFYTLHEFGRTTTAAVHDLGGHAVQVVSTRNGHVTSDHTYQFDTDDDLVAHLDDLDARMVDAGYTRSM